MKCSYCKNEVPTNVKQCPACGAPINQINVEIPSMPTTDINTTMQQMMLQQQLLQQQMQMMQNMQNMGNRDITCNRGNLFQGIEDDMDLPVQPVEESVVDEDFRPRAGKGDDGCTLMMLFILVFGVLFLISLAA